MRHSLFHLFSRPGFLINNDSCQIAVIATDIIISWIAAGLSAWIGAVVRGSNWLPLDVKNSAPESLGAVTTKVKNKKRRNQTAGTVVFALHIHMRPVSSLPLPRDPVHSHSRVYFVLILHK